MKLCTIGRVNVKLGAMDSHSVMKLHSTDRVIMQFGAICSVIMKLL